MLWLQFWLHLEPKMCSFSSVARFLCRPGPPWAPGGVGDALAAALCSFGIQTPSKLQREPCYWISMAQVALVHRDPLGKNPYVQALAQKCDDVEPKWPSHRRDAKRY